MKHYVVKDETFKLLVKVYEQKAKGSFRGRALEEHLREHYLCAAQALIPYPVTLMRFKKDYVFATTLDLMKKDDLTLFYKIVKSTYYAFTSDDLPQPDIKALYGKPVAQLVVVEEISHALTRWLEGVKGTPEEKYRILHEALASVNLDLPVGDALVMPAPGVYEFITFRDVEGSFTVKASAISDWKRIVAGEFGLLWES